MPFWHVEGGAFLKSMSVILNTADRDGVLPGTGKTRKQFDPEATETGRRGDSIGTG